MKRKLSTFLALLLAFGTLGMTACGGDKAAPDTETDLEIFYWNSGNGSDWLDRTIEAFEKKYPEVNVVKNFNEISETWATEIVNKEVNTIDLYLCSMPTILAYTEYLEPLDDIMNEDVDGNGVKLIDKFDKAMMDSHRGADGKLYSAVYGGGVCGLVYNKTVFEEKGYDVPRTTNELSLLAADMVDDKYTPFIFPGNADYWNYCIMPWAAQYGGIEEINGYWNVTYTDPETGVKEELSKKALTTEGRKQSLVALEEVAAPQNYTYKASNAIDHTTAQTLFLEGTALMMPNGSWLENEMRNTKSDIEYAFMRTPIISALGEKLGITDRVLGEVVSYVDSADYVAGVFNDDSEEYDAARVKALDKEIVETVAAARKIVYTEAISNKAAVPNYANAKEWAKKFIQFMNSEEGMSYYYTTLQTPMLATAATELDTSSWSPFMQSAWTLSQNATYVYRAKGHPVFYNNGLEFFNTYPQKFILAANTADRLTSEEYWEQKCLADYNNNWDAWL